MDSSYFLNRVSKNKSKQSTKTSSKGASKEKSNIWKDVATKTTIRSLKRYVRSQITDISKEKQSSHHILMQIEQFCHTFLEDYTEFAAKLNVNFQEIYHFVINLVDPMIYRRLKIQSSSKWIIDMYQDTIYNYTKNKNCELWGSPLFYLLFKIFIERGLLESFLV